MQLKRTTLFAALIVPGMMLGTAAHAEETQPAYGDKAATEDNNIIAATYISARPADAFHASELIGTDVHSIAEDEDEIGKISDLLIGEDGDIKGVVISVGGLMGIGDKEVAVEWDALELNKGEDGDYVVRLNTTQEALEAAEEYEKD